MKKFWLGILCLGMAITMYGCAEDKPVDSDTEEPSDDNPDDGDEETQLLSVKEVLAKPDSTYVEFEGIVIGYDLGKRHIIIEDLDHSCSIQLYKNPGYAKAKVGDLVNVTGYRTFDERGVNRLTPESLVVVSSNNPSSMDNPTVIDFKDLKEWTNTNRTNKDILLKAYKFTNVEIVEFSSNYTYLDNKYDEEGGRGLKIGIKNDSSFFPLEDLHLVQGQRYNITAILYGCSDSFDDETLDGTVLRLSILNESDVEIVTNEGEEATVIVSGKRSFLASPTATKPDLTTYFTVIDSVDGNVKVTPDMITDNINMAAPGVYEVNLRYTNSQNTLTTKAINIYVTEKGSTVTDVLPLVSEGIDVYVNGVILGWSYNNGQKRAMIIQNPTNGDSIEFWVNNKAAFQSLEVGDNVLLYSTALAYEKEMPRLGGTVTIEEKISSGNALYNAIEIEDINAWSRELTENKSNFFGRYTFTATFVETSGNYSYFLRENTETGYIVQLGLYESAIKYDFIPGQEYTITAIAHGISDNYSELENKSIVMRLGIMNESDITLNVEEATITSKDEIHLLLNTEKPDFTKYFTVVDVTGNVVVTKEMITENVNMAAAGTYSVTLTYKGNVKSIEIVVNEEGISVTDALTYISQSVELYVNGVVSGYSYNGTKKRALIIEDSANGKSVELWISDYPEFQNVLVGDKIIVHTTEPKLEKEMPRLGGVIALVKTISQNNELYQATVIENLSTWSAQVAENKSNFFGRYTFTAEFVSKSSSYSYFLRADDTTGNILQIGIHESATTYDFVVGEEYTVTAVAVGISDKFSDLATKSIVMRMSIMNANDVVHNVKPVEGVTITTSGKQFFLLNEEKPDFKSYFTVVDSTGSVTVTDDMITENVNMAVEGRYTVTLTHLGNTKSIEIVVTENGISVTEALNYVGKDVELYVNGVVSGYSYKGGQKKALIIEDSTNGNSVEIWINNKAPFQGLVVGDNALFHTTGLILEKGFPRLGKTDNVTYVKRISQNNELHDPTIIEDLSAWSKDIEQNNKNFFGRYTFTATFVSKSKDYSYFLKADDTTGNIIQIGIHESATTYEFVVGEEYTVTAVAVGISKDPSVLNSESVTLRLSIMNESDIIPSSSQE